MKLMISQNEFDDLKSREKVPLKCERCNKIFYKLKHRIQQKLHISNAHKYCSKKCLHLTYTLSKTFKCKNCKKNVIRKQSELKRHKNVFCSRSCAGTYGNKHKKFGTTRSKLERWIEEQLKLKYPNLEMFCNERKVINGELDFYIPSLKLAFELNGIFHYEPIFGKDKLNKIQNKDKSKFQQCLNNRIELCIIDSSLFRYFKIERAQPFLKIITDVIDKKLNIEHMR